MSFQLGRIVVFAVDVVVVTVVVVVCSFCYVFYATSRLPYLDEKENFSQFVFVFEVVNTFNQQFRSPRL